MPELLSLIIPCFNEENTLENCVERCLVLKEHGIDLELVIVDDCSTDNSYAIAQKLAEKYHEITILHHDINQGKGAALRNGFMIAKGDYVGIQDSDAEYNPLDYITLLKPLQSKKADVVYGSRYLRQGTRRVLYFWHTWMNRSLTFVSNMFTNLDISDMETCYKLFTRQAIQTIAPQLKEKRFGFEPEVTALTARLGYRVYECAIHYEPRSYEEGKKIGWKDGVRALYCIMHYGAHSAPLPMQILLYLFIGFACALVNMFFFIILLSYGLTFTTSTIIAFLIAAACNYILCLLLLFKHKARWSAPGEVIAYIITLCIMGTVDYGVTACLSNIGIGAAWSKALASIIGFVGNFLLRKYLVF